MIWPHITMLHDLIITTSYFHSTTPAVLVFGLFARLIAIAVVAFNISG